MMNKLGCLALTGLFLLTACGFSPIYGSHKDKGPVSEVLSTVAIDSIPDSNGQFLRNKLMDRFYFHGRPTQPQTRLTVTLRATELDFGIQKDATASRSQLNLWADYVLRDNEGKELLKRTAHSVASYNKINAQYGQVATQRNAYERTLTEVSEQITSVVSLYFAEREALLKKPQAKNASPAPAAPAP